jgi:cell division septum initiation protein DivIVA
LNLYFQENNELKNKIISLENEINYFKEKEKKDELFKGSTIIQSIEEKNLISNWILQNTNKNSKLIYKAKRDGDQASDFHSKCDNMGPLLIIIQTTTGN